MDLITYASDFLVERPETQRIWVVRSSGGNYVRHFRKYSVVAIGHTDALGLKKGEVAADTLANIESLLRKKAPERSRSSITSHANQIRNFCNGIKVDDLVVTVAWRGLIIGRVTSDAYIDSEPLSITDIYGKDHLMDLQLRRKIVWGPEILRSEIPSALVMTLLAHQTVFNIDEHWEYIYHLLYPCFYSNNKLYLSTNIRSKDALDNYSVSKLFGLLSGLEAAALQFDLMDEEVTKDLLDGRDLPLNLTSKAEFMSPGAIWSAVAMDPTNIIWCTVIYIMLFGGDVKFFKADGLIDKETRRKAWNLALKLIESHDFIKVKKKLRVDIPRVNRDALDVLEPPAQKQKRARAKNVVKLQDPPTVNNSD